jgi:hypothetical protein
MTKILGSDDVREILNSCANVRQVVERLSENKCSEVMRLKFQERSELKLASRIILGTK